MITPSFFTHTSHKCLLELTPDTTPIEMEVMGWFAADHEILWIPIYELMLRNRAALLWNWAPGQKFPTQRHKSAKNAKNTKHEKSK